MALNKRSKYWLEQHYRGIDFDSCETMTASAGAIDMGEKIKTGKYTIPIKLLVNGYNKIDACYRYNYKGKYGEGYLYITHNYGYQYFSNGIILVKEKG